MCVFHAIVILGYVRDEAPANKSAKATVQTSSHNAGKSGTFNTDFPLWLGGGEHKHSCHVASLLDKRQPGGSRPGEVDDGEDAGCVSTDSLKAFWWWIHFLCTKSDYV